MAKYQFTIVFESVSIKPQEIAKLIISFLQKRGDVVDKNTCNQIIRDLYTKDEFEVVEETKQSYGIKDILKKIQENRNGEFRCWIGNEFNNEDCYINIFEDPIHHFTTLLKIYANTSDGNLYRFILADHNYMNIEKIYFLLINISQLISSRFFVGGYMDDIPTKHLSYHDFCNTNHILPCIIGFDKNLENKKQIITNWKSKFEILRAETEITNFHIIQGIPLRQ